MGVRIAELKEIGASILFLLSQYVRFAKGSEGRLVESDLPMTDIILRSILAILSQDLEL